MEWNGVHLDPSWMLVEVFGYRDQSTKVISHLTRQIRTVHRQTKPRVGKNVLANNQNLANLTWKYILKSFWKYSVSARLIRSRSVSHCNYNFGFNNCTNFCSCVNVAYSCLLIFDLTSLLWRESKYESDTTCPVKGCWASAVCLVP